MSTVASNPRSKRLGLVVLAVLAVACVGAFAMPPVRARVQQWLAAPAAAAKAQPESTPRAATLIEDGHGHDGLRLTDAAIKYMEINPVTAEAAVKSRPLPSPFIGRLSYDTE